MRKKRVKDYSLILEGWFEKRRRLPSRKPFIVYKANKGSFEGSGINYSYFSEAFNHFLDRTSPEKVEELIDRSWNPIDRRDAGLFWGDNSLVFLFPDRLFPNTIDTYAHKSTEYDTQYSVKVDGLSKPVKSFPEIIDVNEKPNLIRILGERGNVIFEKNEPSFPILWEEIISYEVS